MNKHKHAIMTYKKGFTLIELLVVVAIIGILTSVALTSLSGARDKARMASAQGTLSSIRAESEQERNADGDLIGTTMSTTTTSNVVNLCTNVKVIALAQNAMEVVHGVTSAISFGTAGANNAIACQSSSVDFAIMMDIDPDTGIAPAGIKYFCVDSAGASKVVTSPTFSTASACPAA